MLPPWMRQQELQIHEFGARLVGAILASPSHSACAGMHVYLRSRQPSLRYDKAGKLCQPRYFPWQVAKVLIDKCQRCQSRQGAQPTGEACEASYVSILMPCNVEML